MEKISNILSNPDINILANQYITELDAGHKTIKEMVDILAAKYARTDIPEDREVLLMEFLNGNELVYTLSKIDSTLIPNCVKSTGDITLREAVIIMAAHYYGVISDAAKTLSEAIVDEDIKLTDPETPTLENVIIKDTCRSASNVRHYFDIRHYMNAAEHLKLYIEKADFEHIKGCLVNLYWYMRVYNAR